MKSFALITLAIFAIGCSGEAAPKPELSSNPASPVSSAEVVNVSCAGCGTEVAAKDAVEKGGKKMCAACASH